MRANFSDAAKQMMILASTLPLTLTIIYDAVAREAQSASLRPSELSLLPKMNTSRLLKMNFLSTYQLYTEFIITIYLSPDFKTRNIWSRLANTTKCLP